MRSAFVLLAVVGSSLFTRGARAAETPAEPAETPPKALAPVVGASLGTVVATRRLGFSLGVAIDVLLRKRFANSKFAFVTGLRPGYDRYALGPNDDRSCVYDAGPACGGNTFVYASQTTGHVLSLELPLIVEYQSGGAFAPFLGVSGSALWLRASERAQALNPRVEEAIDTSASKLFGALSIFAGVGAKVGKHGSITARFGYRFARSADLPGGNASLRGEIFSFGYQHEL